MDLESEINRLIEIIRAARVRPEGEEVFELARAYASDARHFLGRGERENALEAYAIAWAYIDALLHLGLVEIDRGKELFTVE